VVVELARQEPPPQIKCLPAAAFEKYQKRCKKTALFGAIAGGLLYNYFYVK
jgi:hypothetical protein